MTILRKVEKSIDLDWNVRIVNCPSYRSRYPGTIFCRKRKRFVTLTDCKVCVVGRGA